MSKRSKLRAEIARQEKLKTITIVSPKEEPKTIPHYHSQIPVVSVTLTGNTLTVIDQSDHSVIIPLTIEGLRILKGILIAKELQPTKQFGSNSQPTQQMVDEWLKNRKIEEENEQLSILREF